jgi:branched-chain amino acid transport system ATP-binding protein
MNTSRAASASQPAPHALRLEGVGRRFGALQAVRDVTLDIAPGERRAILGPNGAGKTTLFNVIAGDFPATAGRVLFFAEDVTGLAAQLRTRRGVTRTYQNSLLFTGLSVADNLYLAVRGVRPHRLSFLRSRRGDVHRARAAELAVMVGLAEVTGLLVSELSHGQRRQLELGMALAGEPRLLLLDEPAAGLSPGERAELVRLLAQLPRELTVVIIEHDMDVALQVAERVTVMHNGEVVAEGTPAEVQANETVHRIYLGSHGA